MPGTPVSSALVVALHLQYPTLVLSIFMFNTTNMRFSIVAAVLFLARVVYSQSISGDTAQLPSCSLSCLSNAIINVGCSLTDYVCQCGAHRAAIAAQGVPCIVNSCNTTEALTTQKIVNEICSLALAGTSSGSTTSTGSPAATSPAASGLGSVMGSSIYPATATTAPSTTAQGASTSSSTPAQASKAAGARLEAAGAIAGAAFLVALAL